MTLAYVQGIAALISYLIVTWTGLTIAMALLMPRHATRSESLVADRPFHSFGIGILMILPTAVSVALLGSPLPILKLLGFVGSLVIGAAITVGSSGIALLMGRRITNMTGPNTAFAGLVRGSIVYSLALGFPIVGWFLFLPVALIASLGAGTRALIPSRQTAYPPVTPGSSKPEFDVLERQGAL